MANKKQIRVRGGWRDKQNEGEMCEDEDIKQTKGIEKEE